MIKSIIVLVVLAAFVSANIMPKESTECVVCKYAVSYLEQQISTNTTTQEVIKALENVCKIAPQNLQANCDSLIEEYGSTIIYLLIKAASPEVVCKAVKAC